MLMPKKTRRQKKLSESRRKQKFDKQIIPYHPQQLPSQANSQEALIYFMSDLKKSFFLIAFILMLEFALYFVSIKGYFKDGIRFF